MLVRWVEVALANLNAEAEYIARDNPTAAARTVESIVSAVDQLKEFPAIGRPGRVAGTRELVVRGTPYVLPYRVRTGYVEILRVFHGRGAGRRRFDAGVSKLASVRFKAMA